MQREQTTFILCQSDSVKVRSRSVDALKVPFKGAGDCIKEALSLFRTSVRPCPTGTARVPTELHSQTGLLGSSNTSGGHKSLW